MKGKYQQRKGIRMKTRAICVVLFLMATLVTTAQAHPGGTAADGCHYCRTNCSDWGETAGTRHCHSGYNSTKADELGAAKPNSKAIEEKHSHDHPQDHQHNPKQPNSSIES